MLTYLGAWLHQDYGMKTHQIGSLFMISGLAALASSLLGGYLSDRVGKRRAFLVGNSTTAAAMLVLPWNLGVPLLLTVFFILGFGAAVRQSPMEAIVTELVVSEKRGRYIAFRNLFSQLGIAISVLVGGVLFHTFGYTAVVLLATALTAAGSLLMPKIAE
jgi:predicted MFS family arabinose efflux permease